MDSDLGPLLIEAGAITPNQLAQALALRHKNGGLLLTHLISGGFVTEDQVVSLFCTRRNYRRAAETDLGVIPQEVLDYVPAHLARRYAILPLSVEGDVIYLAAADPSDTQVQAEVAYVTGHRVTPLVSRYSAIMEAIEKYYSKEKTSLPPSFPPPYDPYAADGPWPERSPTKKELQNDESELMSLLGGPHDTPTASRAATLPGLGTKPPVQSTRGAPRFYVSSQPPELGQAERPAIRFYAVSDPNQDAAQKTLRGFGTGADYDATPTIQSPPPQFLSGLPPEEDNTPTIPTLKAASRSQITAASPSEAKPKEEPTSAPKIIKVLKPLAPPPSVEALFPSSDEVLEALQKSERVEDILAPMFRFIMHAFPRPSFFLVKPGLVQGYRGLQLPCPAEELQVPLTSPSLFTSVLLSQFPYVGQITLTPATRGFLRRLGYPCFALLLPINLGSRTIGIFLGDQGDPRKNADTHTFIQLRRLGTSVAQTFLRILKKKRSDAIERQLKLSEEEPSGHPLDS